MVGPDWYHYLVPSIRSRVKFRKAAGLFAGMNHLQPLLLATTNSNYLLDRFCMERCCSGEYVSRIVTSIIFMEILSIIVVRIVLIIGFTSWSNPGKDAGELVKYSQWEEWYRDPISTVILSLALLGYLQILWSFLSGGKKGHMHWFYTSLLIQHFLNSLIAGSIGFWEVGLALWYLVTLPMAPIVVFFYQLIIHSWIRNHGPRDVEYLVVECQIWLALCLSSMATIFWMAGYAIPYDSTTLTIPTTLNGLDTQNTDNHITVQSKEDITLTRIDNPQGSSSINLTVTLSSGQSGGTVTITVYSVTLEVGNDSGNTATGTIYPLKVVTLTLKSAENSLTLTLKASGTLKSNDSKTDVTLTLSAQGSEVTPTGPITIFSGPVTFKNSGSGDVNIQSVTLQYEASSNITNIKVTDEDAQAEEAAPADTVTVKGYTCYPKHGHYISGISKVSSGTDVDNNLWNTTWDGGKCEFVECYYKDPGGSTSPALLRFYVRFGGSLNIYYCGRNSTSSGWKTLVQGETIDTEAETKEKAFITKFAELATGSLDSLGTGSPSTVYANKHNTEFSKVLWNPKSWTSKNPTATWLPLIMQGLSVGAVGSIFPNLIPKTLTCPRTTRSLSVINMFLVTVPHIFNVMLGDMDLLGWIGVGDDWTGPGWHYSLLLYIIYILAILFAIFNVHYPEWRLSTFLRNNTWMVFLMILFTDVLNETFNAISRAGICSQKSAHTPPGQKEKAKNHPCLHNKIACLMNLTYIPFWLTLTLLKH